MSFIFPRFALSIPPSQLCLAIAGLSALALAGALIAQFVFHLRPCELCLMQRVPFALNIGLGLLGFFWIPAQRLIVAGAGLSFLLNSGIAFFHSGVERKWWAGLTGCSTPDLSGSIDDLIRRIQETDVVRCDEIPWSFLGLSMANYNVAFCLALGIFCGFYLYQKRG